MRSFRLHSCPRRGTLMEEDAAAIVEMSEQADRPPPVQHTVMSSSKEALVLHTCMQLLSVKLESFFDLVADLQLAPAVSVLTSAARSEEFLSKHSKQWEEIIHPFKLLGECERKYYEWSFLQPYAAADETAPDDVGGRSKKQGAQQGAEEQLKFVYNQIPLGLRKSMQALHKFIVVAAQQAQAQSTGKLPHSASSLSMLAAAPTAGGSDVFQSTLLLLDELISIFIPLRVAMISFYASLSSSMAPGARSIREVRYDDAVHLLEKLRRKCDKTFTHPLLIKLNHSMVLPELCLLELALGLECGPGSAATSTNSARRAGAMLPAFDWTSTMFTLMRIKADHTRWMNRLVTRDREGLSGAGSSNSNPSLAPAGPSGRKNLVLGGGAGGAGKYSPSLNLSVSPNLVFPSVLHWLHQFHHSVLCKSTLMFWSLTLSKSLEIKGFSDDMNQRLSNLDTHYIALWDRIWKKVPGVYSTALVMDCTTGMGGRAVVDPMRPVTIRDSAVSEEEATAAQEAVAAAAIAAVCPQASPPPSTGGLGQYPVLVSWPSHRAAVLEKWNLVSLLQQKQDLMADLAAAYHTASSANKTFVWPPSIPKQTATYILATGPSNHPADVLIWDYENEVVRATPVGFGAGANAAYPTAPAGSNVVAPGSVSYFLARVDPNKNVYLVITFQAGCNDASAAAGSQGAAQQAAAEKCCVADRLLTQAMSRESTGDSTDSGSSSSAPVAASPLLLTASLRKRAFDQLVSEVVPMLQKLRHMHVFQNLQPNVYKKKG